MDRAIIGRRVIRREPAPPRNRGIPLGADGCEVITRFPAEELMVAGPTNYLTIGGPLNLTRDTQSNRNSASVSTDSGLDGRGSVVHPS